MVTFNLTAFTRATPFIQRKAKTRTIFPQEKFSKFLPISIQSFNFHSTQSLQFSNTLYQHGVTIFQKESHGWNQLSI